jgi:hypothetical protein
LELPGLSILVIAGFRLSLRFIFEGDVNNDAGFTASICKPFRKNELAEMLAKHLKIRK